MSKKFYQRVTKHNRVQAIPNKIIDGKEGKIILYNLFMMK